VTVRSVLIIEGAANLVILLAKLGVGVMTGSIAILGDAVHSVTDIANNVVAYFVIRASEAPPDTEHPYGHRKFEALAVFILATLLTVVAIELALRAFGRIGEPIADSGWGLIVMITVMAINVSVSAWEAMWANRLDSDILRADSRHTFGDVLTTLAVIAGWQLSVRGYPWLDAVTALVVAVLVFYLAYGLFRRVIPVLVDQAAVDTGAVTRTVGSLSAVREVRRVRSRNTGQGVVADVVVVVDGGLPTSESHAVANVIENALRERFGIDDVIVHVEPE